MPGAVIRLALAPVSISARNGRPSTSTCTTSAAPIGVVAGIVGIGRRPGQEPRVTAAAARRTASSGVPGRSMSRSNGERKSRPSSPAIGRPATVVHRQRADRHAGIAGQRPAAQRAQRQAAASGAGRSGAARCRRYRGCGCHPAVALQAEATDHVLAHQRAFGAGVEDERRVRRRSPAPSPGCGRPRRRPARRRAARPGRRPAPSRRAEGDAQEQQQDLSHGGRRSIQPPCATRQPLFLGVSVGRRARLRLRRTGGAASAMVPSGALKIAAPLRAADQHRRRGGGATRPERAGRAAHHAERRVSVVAALLRTRDLAPLPRRAVAAVVQAGLMPVTAGSSWPPPPC